jgi:hypothetical protein
MVTFIILLIIFSFVFIVVFKRLQENGYLGIYQDFDSKHRGIHYWFEGEIIHSFFFEEYIKPEEFIELCKRNEEIALKKMQRQQEIKEKFNKLRKKVK